TFYTATPASNNSTLSIHDALPIYGLHRRVERGVEVTGVVGHDHRGLVRELGDEVLAPQLGRIDLELTRRGLDQPLQQIARLGTADRKSTRLNSSHVKISYAVFCLK